MRGDRGQVAAELVAVVPILACVVLLLAQAVVAGYALWSAGNAARAGARAAHVGGDPRAAALSALPGWLERKAEVDASGSLEVEVEVEAPALLPGLPPIPVGGAASLGGGDAGHG
jgi:hypothetical protein